MYSDNIKENKGQILEISLRVYLQGIYEVNANDYYHASEVMRISPHRGILIKNEYT